MYLIKDRFDRCNDDECVHNIINARKFNRITKLKHAIKTCTQTIIGPHSLIVLLLFLLNILHTAFLLFRANNYYLLTFSLLLVL